MVPSAWRLPLKPSILGKVSSDISKNQTFQEHRLSGSKEREPTIVACHVFTTIVLSTARFLQKSEPMIQLSGLVLEREGTQLDIVKTRDHLALRGSKQ
ncbi:hypothetical protein WAI453_003706 [Rhynchosporium graminicola]